MAQVVNVARDSFGNTIPEAEVTVFTAGTETLATIFSDNNNTLTKPNPFDADDQGQYKFFADPGEIKIRVTKQGFDTFEVDFIPVPLTSFSESEAGSEASYVGVDINIPAGAPSQIPLNTNLFDDDSMLTALPVITVNTIGIYQVTAQFNLRNTSTSTNVQVTTATVPVVPPQPPITHDVIVDVGNSQFVTVTSLVRVATAGLTIDLTLQASGGGSIDVAGNSALLALAMMYPL